MDDDTGEQNSRVEALRQPGAGLILDLFSPGLTPKPVFSGFMTDVDPKVTVDQRNIVISGLSDDQILWDYLVFPTDPDWERADGQAFPNAAYDVQSGVAETIMKHYVAFNCQDTRRIAPDTTAINIGPNLGRGGNVTGRGRFQLLGDLLQELAVVGGNLNFSILNRIFDITVPVDRTAEQVFSVETGNILEFAGMIKAPNVTNPIVAGGGEEVQRVFFQLRDLAAETKWGRHIERLIDARDTTDLTELRQRATQAQLDGAEVSAVDLRAIDRPNRQFGIDWNLSDFVTAQGNPSVVSTVQITLDENGDTITPTMDSVTVVNSRAVLAFFDSIRTLRRQVNLLQRTK